MYEEFLVELKRIADALERIAHKEVMLDVSDSISSKSAKHADVGAASTENTHVFDIDIPYATLKDAVFAYQDTHGYGAAETLLKSFGAKFIKDLKPEQYGAVMEALK